MEVSKKKNDKKLDINCPNCHEQYTLHGDKLPKVLSCLHSLCLKCCQELINVTIVQNDKENANDILSCTICNEKTIINNEVNDVQQLPNHYPLINELTQLVLKNLKDIGVICNNCDENKQAHWKCLHCDECFNSFCDDCNKQHGSLKALRSHRVITMSEYIERSQNALIRCNIHDEECDIFCKDCDVTTCRSCADNDHKFHEQVSIEERANTEKVELELNLDAMAVVMERSNIELKRIRDIRDSLLATADHLDNSVTSTFAEIRELIDARYLFRTDDFIIEFMHSHSTLS